VTICFHGLIRPTISQTASIAVGKRIASVGRSASVYRADPPEMIFGHCSLRLATIKSSALSKLACRQ
jgi:hypothetical protein